MAATKVYQPTIDLKVKTADGARHQSKGEVTEAHAFAVYMFNWLYEVTPAAEPPSEFMQALATFKVACEKYRLEVKA